MVEDDDKWEQIHRMRDLQALEKEAEPDFKTAQARLANLGLSLEDLLKYELVLDVGAKDCEIAKVVQAKGRNSVISIDKNFSHKVLSSGLRVLKEDAGHLSLENNQADLILARSSAYYYTKTERETLLILNELNRVLKEGGEQRVYPARFGHIIRALQEENVDFWNATAKPPERRSSKDLAVIQSCDAMANVRTMDFLGKHSIFAKRREGFETNAEANFKDYISIPKF